MEENTPKNEFTSGYQSHDNGFMLFAVETDGYGYIQLSSPDSKVLCTVEYDDDKTLAENVAALVAVAPEEMADTWRQVRQSNEDGTIVWRYRNSDAGKFSRHYAEVAAHGPFFWHIGDAIQGGPAKRMGHAETLEQAQGDALAALAKVDKA